MIDLAIVKKCGCFKTLNSIFSKGAQQNIYLKSKTFTFFNALNDGVDQTIRTIFTIAVSIELCYIYNIKGSRLE